MSNVYSCPHCRAQNFATKARVRMAASIPLECWKCGRKIKKSFSPKGLPKKRKEKVKN